LFDSNSGVDIGVDEGVQGLTIVRDLFSRTSTQPLAIRVGGASGASNSELVIGSNLIVGGRIQVALSDDIAVSSNIVLGGTQATTDPELALTGPSNHATVTRNRLLRMSTTAAPVLSVTGTSGTVIDGNHLLQTSAAWIVLLDSALDLV